MQTNVMVCRSNTNNYQLKPVTCHSMYSITFMMVGIFLTLTLNHNRYRRTCNCKRTMTINASPIDCRAVSKHLQIQPHNTLTIVISAIPTLTRTICSVFTHIPLRLWRPIPNLVAPVQSLILIKYMKYVALNHTCDITFIGDRPILNANSKPKLLP